MRSFRANSSVESSIAAHSITSRICLRHKLDQPRAHLEPHVEALPPALADNPADLASYLVTKWLTPVGNRAGRS